MKALVLCGALPQIHLIKDLKSRGITTVLADMNEQAAARKYADKFYPVSALDVEGIRRIAIEEKVDFIITVCADQALQVVAQVSEMLGLPCYIDFATAENVSKKSYMKKIFVENGIPTSSYVIMDSFDIKKVSHLRFPLIVKPVDSYSSNGVLKVTNTAELKDAFENARQISRTQGVIVEEFVEGNELTVDVYVEEGKAHVLCISDLNKIGEDGKFIIHRAFCPADITNDIALKVEQAAQKIAGAFGLKNSPMLIQLINTGKDISIIEFCARTGGSIKFSTIERVTGFDVIKAVVDVTLGKTAHVEVNKDRNLYLSNQFLYCNPGVLDSITGLEELLADKIITRYEQFKPKGSVIAEIKSSASRVGYFTVEGSGYEELKEKLRLVSSRIKVLDANGNDILRHDIISNC
ncbi:MAG: ATP-grasp domain-containing protein [Ruminococcaceae bacterium]|nr:ATP-grasp domain-containing protein [Oscillospiraceae bacterium]